MIRDNLLSFFDQWPVDKKIAQEVLESNKRFNSDLKSGMYPGKNYPRDKKKYSLYKSKSAAIISQHIPILLHSKAGIPEVSYSIEGSIGQGNPAEIPWICVFDRDITESAQKGFYLVYLFTSDLSGVYLSLNQGWTQYESEYGVKEGRKEIKKNANTAKSLLRSDQGFSYAPVNLKAKGSLGKGYEAGNICSVYYESDNLPSEIELINDLRNLIGVYRELKGRVGAEIFEINSQLDEDLFQEETQRGKRKELQAGAIEKKERKNVGTSSSWSRNPDIAYTALSNADFQCENDVSHKTFISAKTGRQFMEAHHLIPMEFQDKFEVSIDVPENIISLCPNCHRSFHSSLPLNQEILIRKFFSIRSPQLTPRGIDLSVEELLKFY